MTYLFDFNYGTNAWHLAHHPESVGGYDENEYRLPGDPPEGDWSIYAEVFGVSDGAATGLVVEIEGGRAIALLGAWNFGPTPVIEGGEDIYVRQHPGTIWLRIDYHSDEQELHLRSAISRGEWQDLARVPVATPVDTGLWLWYTDPQVRVDGYLTNVSMVPTTEDLDGYIEYEVPYARFPSVVVAPRIPDAVPGITTDVEPMVYALIGAPFGDQEFDIGKSARWLEYFSDKLFVLDVNLGDPRYWIINWTLTLPQAEHAVTNINFFERPVAFRKEQYAKAQKQYAMEDDSWILFVDGSEGISFDNSSLPDDYDFLQFMTFVYREIARAEDNDEDSVVLPFFVFLRSAEVQNVTYDHRSNGDGSTPAVLQAVSVPYYLPYQGLRRLVKVSVLRDPAFDWATLDAPTAPTAGAKAQIVSYAYAHWQYLNIPPGQTEVPPMTEDNDEGFKMRKRISQVRSVSGLPTATWDPDDQPVGVPGPWAVYTLTNTNPDFVPITDTPVTEPAAAALGVKTPLYDTVIRLNLRDGVWYEGDASGNTPMTWDSVNQKWTTPYDPNIWPSTGDQGGINAPLNPDFVAPPTPTLP